MKQTGSIILHAPEVIQALEHGMVLIVRPVMPQPPKGADIIGPEMYEPVKVSSNGVMYAGKPVFGVYDSEGEWGVRCPFGGPGESRWVKETWGLRLTKDHAALGKFGDWLTGQQDLLRADGVPMKVVYRADRETKSAKWRSSAHMLRLDSRLTFKLLYVRVEGVQEITDAEVLAAGVEQRHIDKWRELLDSGDAHGIAFGELWNSRYGNRKKHGNRLPIARADNPLVWTCGFEVVT